MDERLNNYHWEQAFLVALDSVGAVVGTDTPTDPFTREDVKKIYAMIDGERDESDWVILCKLHDGRYAALRAGCDYTGWD